MNANEREWGGHTQKSDSQPRTPKVLASRLSEPCKQNVGTGFSFPLFAWFAWFSVEWHSLVRRSDELRNRALPWRARGRKLGRMTDGTTTMVSERPDQHWTGWKLRSSWGATAMPGGDHEKCRPETFANCEQVRLRLATVVAAEG
jgi:hypothetical protein